tara:strand:- start:8342 stop:9112 length:771 start_codon:yes stop_codon:yes gene_type:complete
MEKKYRELLAKEHYEALSADEKAKLKELCTNQAEFEEAQALMRELSALDDELDLFDSRKVKQVLDKEFLAVYPSRRGGAWINFLFPPFKPIMNRPGIQLATVLVLFVGSYLVLELIDFNDTKTVKLAKNGNKLLIEDADEPIDFETEENAMLDEKTVEKNINENIGLPAELIEVLEVEVPHESQETELVIDVSISEESSIVGSIQEDFRAIELNELRTDFDNGTVNANDDKKEIQKFLIPTIQESPELLEGLFVTF